MIITLSIISVVIVFKRSFSPVWPWGSTGSEFEWGLHLSSAGLRPLQPTLPLLTLSILQPGHRVSPPQHTITSVFPPGSNHCHLHTQQLVFGSDSPVFSPLQSVCSTASPTSTLHCWLKNARSLYMWVWWRPGMCHTLPFEGFSDLAKWISWL